MIRVQYQRLMDFNKKSACNLVPIKIQTEAKNSNELCISYSTKAAKVIYNSTVLQLVWILLYISVGLYRSYMHALFSLGVLEP